MSDESTRECGLDVCAGKSTQNSEPSPATLRNPIWPRISSTRRLVITRPMPVPWIGPVSWPAL
jgi:hypothetical protein